MTTKISNDDIKEYYNQTQILYNLFYSKGTNGLHYGFWYKDTKKPSEAILNTNRFVLKVLQIDKNDSVLDAGCGIGGTSVFIAENTGAMVSGITLSEVQIQQANQLASKSKSSKLLEFSKQDFTKTKFDDNSFSKIFGIESICHAHKKIDFLREAYRILKKGGKIAVVDGFLERQNLSDKENKIYSKWLYGWGVPNLATKESFQNDLKKVGFKKIKYYNMFNEIKKSRDRIYRLAFFAHPLSWIFQKLGIFSKKMHDNTISGICQKKVFSDSDNIATYGVFVAEK